MTKQRYTPTIAPSLGGQKGFNLVELMVAIALGIFLVLGVTNILFSDQQSFNAANRLARVQENGNLAKNMLANDLKRARYMGANVRLTHLAGTEASQAPAATCNPGGNSWARMVQQGLFAIDDQQLNKGSTYRCITSINSGAQARRIRGDILTVRFAAPWPVTAFQRSTLYIRSSFTSSWIFTGENESNLANSEQTILGMAPDPINTTHELIAYSYYIGDSGRKDCEGRIIPSLFRVRLRGGRPQPEELFPGIEDFQVQFLTDSGSYQNAGGIGDWDRVSATHIWLLMRSECTEAGFQNQETYQFANVSFKPNDGYPRELYSSIINHRNRR